MGLFHRIGRLVAGLVQGFVFALLTVLCGGLVGAAVGFLPGRPDMGGLVGLGVGALLTIVGFAGAVEEPVSPGVFLQGWFRGFFLAEVGLGMAVASYFLQLKLAQAVGLEWQPGMVELASGALAVMLWLPTSFAILAILFPTPGFFVEERVERGGLFSFREVLARASRLGGTRRKSPSRGRQ